MGDESISLLAPTAVPSQDTARSRTASAGVPPRHPSIYI
jgi:hypothetical protein